MSDRRAANVAPVCAIATQVVVAPVATRVNDEARIRKQRVQRRSASACRPLPRRGPWRVARLARQSRQLFRSRRTDGCVGIQLARLRHKCRQLPEPRPALPGSSLAESWPQLGQQYCSQNGADECCQDPCALFAKFNSGNSSTTTCSCWRHALADRLCTRCFRILASSLTRVATGATTTCVAIAQTGATFAARRSDIRQRLARDYPI